MSLNESVELTERELKRYNRHVVLPQVSLDGQKKLKAAKILVVGAGGLGSPALSYLAAVGVGELGVIDSEQVDESNLQRQIIHNHSNIGKPKPISAKERILEINPHVRVEAYSAKFQKSNAEELVSKYDIVIDGTDNLVARYLINDTCAGFDKPYIYGAISEFEGQISVFWASRGPCYRCLYPEAPARHLQPTGVLGVLPGVVGCLQAMEAIKVILNIGDILIGQMLHYDALGAAFRKVNLKKSETCVACSKS